MKAATRLIWSLGLILGALATSQAAVTGTVRSIGGDGPGFADGDNLTSLFNYPAGLAVDSQGHVVIADFLNNRVRLVDPTTEIASTFTSTGLSGPTAVALDGSGRVFVANYTAGNVRRFDPSGLASLLFATNLVNPTAIAMDGSGNIYVTEQAGRIRRFTPAGVLNQTLLITNGAPALSGLVVLGDGQLAVSDMGNHVIWKIPYNSSTNAVPTMFAGTFRSAGFREGGLGTGQFNSPQQLAVTTNGVIVVADRLNHRIRAVNDAGVVSTLYGTDPANWGGNFPGWTDGAAGDAELREPFGVAVDTSGRVFDSELFYDVIRMASGLTFPTNTTTGTTPPPPSSGNANHMTLGFLSGEASSRFQGAAGQHFYAPITLSVTPGTKIYGLQFRASFAGTNVAPTFQSALKKPLEASPGIFVTIPPATPNFTGFVTNSVEVTTTTPTGSITRTVQVIEPTYAFAPLVITNELNSSLGIGWLERYTETNLYNTLQQDLITYSQAHDTLFSGAAGRIVVGSFGFTIPAGAVSNQVFKIAVERPSANGDGVGSDVPLDTPEAPTDTLAAAIQNLVIGKAEYLVGDVAPFRWFNAGDFGDGAILNNDLEQLQQSFVYGFNKPPQDSDMYDALDSCCNDVNGNPVFSTDPSLPFKGDDAATINKIMRGDKNLTLADLYVSFRRSLDSNLVNVVRYWTNATLQVRTITNSFRGNLSSDQLSAKTDKKNQYDVAHASEGVIAEFTAGNAEGKPGDIVQIPISLTVSGPFTVRSIALSVSVEAQNGAPPISTAIQFAPGAGIPGPSASAADSPGVFTGMWFEMASGFAAGSFELGKLSVRIPNNANADSVYAVKIGAAQASTALVQFDTLLDSGMIVMSNRALAPWTDAISADWRLKYFGSLMDIASAPNADADGDGVSNLDEFLAGTSPKDILSRLVVRVQSTEGGASLIVSWPSVLGKLYRLESSTNLSTWTTLEDGISGTDQIIQRLRPADGTVTRFYRINAY